MCISNIYIHMLDAGHLLTQSAAKTPMSTTAFPRSSNRMSCADQLHGWLENLPFIDDFGIKTSIDNYGMS